MRNSFIVRFAVSLWLTSIGITGFWATPLGALAAWLLGDLADRGILMIDLSMTSLRAALEDDAFRDQAKKAYDHATARVYTEAEKKEIRQEYLDIISRFGSIGDGVSNS